MTYEHLLIENEQNVRVLTVNRPQSLNALNLEVLRELRHAVDGVADDGSVRCLVLTGAGERAFVAGADIAAMQTMSPTEGRDFARYGQSLMHALEGLPVPVIAAVNGFALGGGLELALACDLIVATATARFGQPEINLGIIPGFGGSQRLPRRVGAGAARRLIYTGELIGAEQALRLGLVDEVVAPDALHASVRQLAQTLAAKAPLALQQAKAAIQIGLQTDSVVGCRYEAEAFGVTFSTVDRSEGMKAFLAKRPAKFTGA